MGRSGFGRKWKVMDCRESCCNLSEACYSVLMPYEELQLARRNDIEAASKQYGWRETIQGKRGGV